MLNTYIEAFKSWLGSMSENWSPKLLAGGIMAFLTGWFGEDAWLIAVLLCLIVADTVLGLASAVAFDGKLSGKRLHQGLVKFLAYAAAIIMVWLVQEISSKTLPIELPVLAIFAAYQALTEMSSIARHFDRMGIKMPALLLRILDAGKKKADSKLDDVLGDKQAM